MLTSQQIYRPWKNEKRSLPVPERICVVPRTCCSRGRCRPIQAWTGRAWWWTFRPRSTLKTSEKIQETAWPNACSRVKIVGPPSDYDALRRQALARFASVTRLTAPTSNTTHSPTLAAPKTQTRIDTPQKNRSVLSILDLSVDSRYTHKYRYLTETLS